MNQIDIKPTFPDLNNRFSTIVPSSVDLYDRIQAQTEKKKEDPNQREIGIEFSILFTSKKFLYD